MSDLTAIQFRQVTKYFKSRGILSAGMKNLLLQLPRRFQGLGNSRHSRVLEKVSFVVSRGESVGIIGRNGCGKTTTLSLIAGVLQPNEGSVEVRGHVCPLLELGAGFRQELSGLENIFLNGVLLGMTRRQVKGRLAEIAEFSELGEFLDHPVRTYSSGMTARLGFSIAVHVNPEILLVDEVLAVGDSGFAAKCRDRISAFRAQGVTIVFVSHNTQDVVNLCNRVIWLQDGQVRADGEARSVCRQYEHSVIPLSAQA